MTSQAEKALWIVKEREDDAEIAYDNDPAGSYRLSAQAAAARRTWVEDYPEAASELAKQDHAEMIERVQERADRTKRNLKDRWQ